MFYTEGMKVRGVILAARRGGIAMEVPKVAVQVGQAEEKRKIYIEDYVLAYLKRLRVSGEKTGDAALFGESFRKEGTSCYVIYGAAALGCAMREGRAAAEAVRAEFFPQYTCLGCMDLRDGRGKIYLSADGKDGVPGKTGGYFVFYEPNEAMENYLIKGQETELREEPEGRPYLPEREGEHAGGPLEAIKTLVVGSLIVLCIIAITALNSYDKLRNFADTASHIFAVMEEEEPHRG